jgi:hypothetical protein
MITSINKGKIAAVLKQIENIQFAYLFGSQAKNKARFGSDLDIAIFFEHEPQLLEIGMLVNQMEEASNCNVDLISLNDLDEKNPKLAFAVVAEGLLLFCNNERLLTEFKKSVFIKYLDFKPIIDLFEKKLHERISNNKFADFGK